MKRNKLEVVQILRRKQPKQIHWLRDARAAYFAGTDIDKLWSRPPPPCWDDRGCKIPLDYLRFTLYNPSHEPHHAQHST
jgi:hypothetical protein